MLRDPTLYQRLQSALDKEFGSIVGDLDIDALAKSPLLNAYINEALRMDPPTPLFVQRRVPEEGAILSGYALPGDMNIRVSPYQGSFRL